MGSTLSQSEEAVREAAEATKAVMEAAGGHSAADFLLTFINGSNTESAARSSDDEAAPAPSPFPFQLIVLAGMDTERRFSSENSGMSGVEFGVNALLFRVADFAHPVHDLERTLYALASIPPFTTLVLRGLRFIVDEGTMELRLDRRFKVRKELRDALVHALCSGNFCDLWFIGVVLPKTWAHQLRVRKNSLQSLRFEEAGNCFSLLFENLVLPSVLSTSLTSLAILCTIIDPAQMQKLLASLEESPSLNHLSLFGSRWQGGWPTGTAILDSLRRNAILGNLDLTGTLFERDSAIAAQVRKNAENAGRLEVLRSQGVERVRPSTIRLHLCGLPLSGKTTISRSLAKCSEGSIFSRWLSERRDTIKLSDRTRGIEVTTLENQQEQQRISIWDMAGQMEYHSFHDSMLPDLTDRAIPPLFLYVWNPFEMNAQNKVAINKEGQNKRKSSQQFEADFKYWLKFIASKTFKSKKFKPKVIVAITRVDLGLPDIKQFLSSSFNAIHEEFKEYIDFGIESFFEVDARNLKMIFELRSRLFKYAETILREAPDDFKVCDEARKVFTNLIHTKKIPPLVTKARFLYLSQKHLGIKSQEVCEAVALSLNSSGDLIYFPSLELVVVDTRWFCQKIMGDLLYFDTKSMTLAHYKGFFPIDVLQHLLEEGMNSNRHKMIWTRGASKSNECLSLKVSGDALVKLLIGLRLACEEDYDKTNPKIFIPASLCGKARNKIVPSEYFELDKSCESYIGRRWAVKDSTCTFLTPGVFPLLQVTFRNDLFNQKIKVKLEQDVMKFASEGNNVLVEFCRLEGKDYFIDVLVGLPDSNVQKGLEWIHETVSAPMKAVFADSRGIPGVEVVESVIQPASIQKEARERPAVSVDELQNIMRKHVQKKGATEELIKSVRYTWQDDSEERCCTHDTVMHLLGEVEVAQLVEAYRGSLREAADDLSSVIVDVQAVEERTHQRQKPQFGITSLEIQLEAIYDLVNDVRDDVKRDLKQLAVQVEDLRGAVLPKLNQIFTFVQEGEAGKLPRMFVVTQEVGNVRRLVAKVVPSLRNAKLELLCECGKGGGGGGAAAHLVHGQRPGLSITTLDDGLLKRGLPFINAFLKVAYVASKIGEAIPDFSRLLDGLDPTISSSMKDDYSSSSRVDFRKGQQWLFDVLSHHNYIKGDQIYTHFGLRRIRYTDSRVAWVCDKHYSEGQPFPA